MSHKTVLKLRCPDCGHKWRWPGDQDLPGHCPKNGCNLSVPDPDFVPSKMNIGTVTGKSGDWAYDKLVADSEARAEAALPAIEQQLRDAGIPADQAQRMATQQASELKVSNMHDNMREGDVAAMPSNPDNLVSRTAAAYKEALGIDYFQGGGMMSGAPAAPVAESGAKFMKAMQGNVWGSRAAAGKATVAGMSAGFGKVGP
jgi:hypothetical protein